MNADAAGWSVGGAASAPMKPFVLDICLLFIVIAWTAAECRREFGRSLFNLLAIWGGLWLACQWYVQLGRKITLLGAPALNQGVMLLLIFVAVTAAGLTAAYYLQRYLRWTLETGQKAASGLMGFVGALLLAHMLVKFVAVTTVARKGGPALIVSQSYVGREILYSHTYHEMVSAVRDLE
jgi:uncharacterized membrane protein required for colicin V production